MRTFLLAAVLLTGCTAATTPQPAGTTPAPTPAASAQVGIENLNSILWIQTSVEFRATAAQTYGMARALLDQGLATPDWSAPVEQTAIRPDMKPAIIVDADETIWDTTAYQAGLMPRNLQHTDERFEEWAKKHDALPLEGAVDFLNYAKSRGVKVFYVTNRMSSNEASVRRTLARHGFPVETDEDVVLTKGENGWTVSNKGPRREYVSSRYRVLLLLGDDFNDFLPVSGKSLDERMQLFKQHRDRFGTRWLMISNPVYGSWERAILNHGRDLTPQQIIDMKKKAMRAEQ